METSPTTIPGLTQDPHSDQANLWQGQAGAGGRPQTGRDFSMTDSHSRRGDSAGTVLPACARHPSFLCLLMETLGHRGAPGSYCAHPSGPGSCAAGAGDGREPLPAPQPHSVGSWGVMSCEGPLTFGRESLPVPPSEAVSLPRPVALIHPICNAYTGGHYQVYLPRISQR